MPSLGSFALAGAMMLGVTPVLAAGDMQASSAALPCNAWCRAWLGAREDARPEPTRRPVVSPVPKAWVMPVQAASAPVSSRAAHTRKVAAKPFPVKAVQPSRAAERPDAAPTPRDVALAALVPPAALEPALTTTSASVLKDVAAMAEPIVTAQAAAAPEPVVTVAAAGPDAPAAAEPTATIAVADPTPRQAPADAVAALETAQAPEPSRTVEVMSEATPWTLKLGFYAVIAAILAWAFRPARMVDGTTVDSAPRRRPRSAGVIGQHIAEAA